MKVSIESIQDKEFWRTLFPDFHIEDEQLFEQLDAYTIPDNDLDSGVSNLREEGYFQIGEVVSAEELAKLRQCIIKVEEATGYPLFAILYDEFWHIVKRLSSLYQAVLGERCWILPAFWVWHLKPSAEEAGWRPHRDALQGTLRADKMPNTMTIWIAISDATPLNGCMYIVPASRDHNYPHNLNDISVQDLRDIRALPASAGDVLGWNTLSLHWGGRSSKKAKQARMSFAFELQRGDIPAQQSPLLRPSKLPDLKTRLQIIGTGLKAYTHMTDVTAQMTTIANAIS